VTTSPHGRSVPRWSDAKGRAGHGTPPVTSANPAISATGVLSAGASAPVGGMADVSPDRCVATRCEGGDGYDRAQ
jgi:hypothetical protein